MNVNEAPSLLRNDAPPENHWLKINLIGTKSNRSGIGARVTVRYGSHLQMQELVSQSSYLSSNDPRLHFGLGTATEVEVDVSWPSGKVDKLGITTVDRFLTVKEGTGVLPKKFQSK
jgi:hypothetical protein